MGNELKQIGMRLRAERHKKAWTLEDLASRAQMSVSTLSRLESGKRQASLELLVPLTQQLGIRIDDLITQETPDPRVRREVIKRDGLTIVPLAPEGAPVHTYKITFPPLKDDQELKVHDGYEWLYVISGKLRLILGDQDLVLSRGEAAEFDTTIPHAMGAAEAKEAQVISIFNDTGVRLHTHVPQND